MQDGHENNVTSLYVIKALVCSCIVLSFLLQESRDGVDLVCRQHPLPGQHARDFTGTLTIPPNPVVLLPASDTVSGTHHLHLAYMIFHVKSGRACGASRRVTFACDNHHLKTALLRCNIESAWTELAVAFREHSETPLETFDSATMIVLVA